jgi:hypothetical protein
VVWEGQRGWNKRQWPCSTAQSMRGNTKPPTGAADKEEWKK